jgi:hypothetical protein
MESSRIRRAAPAAVELVVLRKAGAVDAVAARPTV